MRATGWLGSLACLPRLALQAALDWAKAPQAAHPDPLDWSAEAWAVLQDLEEF